MYPVPRIGPVDSKELVPIFEVLTAERLIDRVVVIVEFDKDMLVVVVVVGAARTDHYAKLGPVLAGAGPVREGHRGAVDA